jgi:transcription initiation factor TFIID subunit 12
MKIPGFASEDTRQSQNRRLNIPPGYAARLAAVKESGKKR